MSSERLFSFNKYITYAIRQLSSAFDNEDVSVFVCLQAKKYGLHAYPQIVIDALEGRAYASLKTIVYDPCDPELRLTL